MAQFLAWAHSFLWCFLAIWFAAQYCKQRERRIEVEDELEQMKKDYRASLVRLQEIRKRKDDLEQWALMRPIE